MTSFTVFDTPIGQCGIAWDDDDTIVARPPARRALRRHAHEGTPPPAVQSAIDCIVASLHGEADDLIEIPLDFDGVAPFSRRVYEVVRTIPAGETMSYGEVAAAVGSPGAARAVGQALGRNPFAIIVPCHRVLAAGGKAGGFTAADGVTTKLQMLAIEGVLPTG